MKHVIKQHGEGGDRFLIELESLGDLGVEPTFGEEIDDAILFPSRVAAQSCGLNMLATEKFQYFIVPVKVVPQE